MRQHMKKLAGGFDSFRKMCAKYWRQCESYSVAFEVWLPLVERHGPQTSICFQNGNGLVDWAFGTVSGL